MSTQQTVAPRRGQWMQTASGKAWFHEDPLPRDVDIVDIAHALGNICRYGGHSRRFYSVAEHSVLVSYVVPQEHALVGLLHDATEAYVGDVPRPLKLVLGEAYTRIEDAAWRAIAQKFQLAEQLPPEVKRADNEVLLAEKAALMGPSPMPWSNFGVEPAENVVICCHVPAVATRNFLRRFAQLTARRTG